MNDFIEEQAENTFVGFFLKINQDDYLLINSYEDRLIIDETLWNETKFMDCNN